MFGIRAIRRGVALALSGAAAAALHAQPCNLNWSSLGNGAPPGPGGWEGLATLAVLDLGAGPELYAGANSGTRGVLHWTGQTWALLGDLGFGVYALTVYDDGT